MKKKWIKIRFYLIEKASDMSKIRLSFIIFACCLNKTLKTINRLTNEQPSSHFFLTDPLLSIWLPSNAMHNQLSCSHSFQDQVLWNSEIQWPRLLIELLPYLLTVYHPRYWAFSFCCLLVCNWWACDRASEWVSAACAQVRQAKRAVRSNRISERRERTSEQTSEWPSTYIWVF